MVQLSIVTVCWNCREVILDALQSIIDETQKTSYEILVSDNGSTDGSVEAIEATFSDENIRVIRNGKNVGFARGNNAAIRHVRGQYVLLLNPDTVVLDGAIDKWMEYVESQSDVVAHGLRLLYGDGSYQVTGRPFPTNRRIWQQVFGMGFLGLFVTEWNAGGYSGWDGRTDRDVDWQSGACLMIRADVLRQLRGLDPQFFYHFEEVDLCYRIQELGYSLRFFAGASIIHLLGHTVKDDRSRFQIESLRNRLRYFAKHYGPRGAANCRIATFFYFFVRGLTYSIKGLLQKREETVLKSRMAFSCCRWLWHLDVSAFLKLGVEPDLGFLPLLDHDELVKARQDWA